VRLELQVQQLEPSEYRVFRVSKEILVKKVKQEPRNSRNPGIQGRPRPSEKG